MKICKYAFYAKVDRVVDGDTIDLIIDIGWETYKKVRVRLCGVDTPEVRTRDAEEKKAGLAAKAWVESVIPEGTPVWFQSYEYDKYGRTLGRVYLIEDTTVGMCINDELLKRGFAEIYV